MTAAKRYEEFLKEYEALCMKHRIIVGSCGCCDSPYLLLDTEGQFAIDDSTIENHVRHLKEGARP